ncbi:Nephrocystin-1 [Dionaea muscipula]
MLRHLRIVNWGDIYYPTSTPKVKFDVPRLKCFEFVGEVSELYSIKSSNALVIADINVFDNRRDHILSLIIGLSNATTVKLSEIHYGDMVSDYVDDCSYLFHSLPDHLPIFWNVLELEVNLGPRDSHAILPQILQHMLSKSPNLETLVFRKGFRHCYSHLWEIVASQPFTWSSQVKVIQVNDFSGSTKEVEMVTFFLTKAIGLKKLNVASDEG